MSLKTASITLKKFDDSPVYIETANLTELLEFIGELNAFVKELSKIHETNPDEYIVVESSTIKNLFLITKKEK